LAIFFKTTIASRLASVDSVEGLETETKLSKSGAKKLSSRDAHLNNCADTLIAASTTKDYKIKTSRKSYL
jgi:hypothetical protein